MTSARRHPGQRRRSPRPKQPVDGPQPGAPWRLSLQDRQLMPQRRVLDLKRHPASQAGTKRREEDETDGSHSPSG